MKYEVIILLTKKKIQILFQQSYCNWSWYSSQYIKRCVVCTMIFIFLFVSGLRKNEPLVHFNQFSLQIKRGRSHDW